MCSDQRHGTPQELADNLRQPMPLSRKLRLIIRNGWIRIRTGSNCCGNHGEPGC